MTSLAGRLWERARRPGVIDRAAIADRIATRHERLVAPLPLAAVAGRYTGPAPEGGELPVARARPAPVERSRPDAAAPAPSGPPVIQLKALPSAPAPQPPAAPPLSVVTGHGGHYADGGPRPDSRPAPRLALVSALPPRLARPVPADAVPADAVPADAVPADAVPASPVPADLGPDTPGPASAGPAASGPAGSGPGPGRAQPGPPPTVLTPSPFSSPPPASLLADAPGPVGGLRAGPPADGGAAPDRSRPVTAAPPAPGSDGHAMALPLRPLRAGRLLTRALAPVAPASAGTPASPFPGGTASTPAPPGGATPPVSAMAAAPAPPPGPPVRLTPPALPATVTPPATTTPATVTLPATTTQALAARLAQLPGTGPAGTPAEDAPAAPSLPGQPASASATAHPVAGLPLRAPGLTAVPADRPPAGAAAGAVVRGAAPRPVVTATARPAAATWPRPAGTAVPMPARATMAGPAPAPGEALTWPQPFVGGHGASPAPGGVPAVLPLAGGRLMAGAASHEQAAPFASSLTSRVPGAARPAPAGGVAAGPGATAAPAPEGPARKPQADRIDLDLLAGQVQRRVVRQLAIEAERRRFR